MSFDLNEYGPQLPELNEHAKGAVTAALSVITVRGTASATSQLAALQGARAALYSLASANQISKKTMKALETISLAVKGAEDVLRLASEKEKKAEKKKGGRPFKGASLEQRMATKLAVDWLTELAPPLSPEAAISAVTKILPVELVPMSSARKWVKEDCRDEYTRQKKGTRGRKSGALYERALADAKFELFEQFEESWNILCLDDDSDEPIYARQKLTRTHLDATPEQVLSWLKEKLEPKHSVRTR